MNTNDLNARSSLTRRQRRSQAPRVECLESRELLTYPAAGVAYLINQALFHHKNTAVQVVTGVNKSLTADLTAGPLATLLSNGGPSGITLTSAQTFVSSVDSVVATYQSSAAAQLSPRFPWVYSQIFTYSQNIETGVASQLTQYESTSNNTLFWENVTWIINHGGPGGPPTG